jgi:membrane protein implicated in regulation of membrane protease activity
MITETQVAMILLIIGALMILFEALSPGNFLLVPGTILIIIGFLALVFPGLLYSWWSPILVLVIFVPVTYLTIKLYQRIAPPAPPETTVATSLVGLRGIVLDDVFPNNLKGKVRIANDTWSASSHDHIHKGTKVIVERSEGVHVFVVEDKGQTPPKATIDTNRGGL